MSQSVTVVNAKLTFTLRALPEHTRTDKIIYFSVKQEQRGLPQGVQLAGTLINVGVTVKQWDKAWKAVLALAREAKPFVMVIEAHVSASSDALLAFAKGIQVFEGKVKIAQSRVEA